jgi:hypothetical protein
MDEKKTPAEQETVERVAALLLTMPGWDRNYTSTLDSAAWMVVEAERVGWNLQVLDSLTILTVPA